MEPSSPLKIVLIGASTGGPGQIQKIITSLPQLHNTSIIIAQHMVEGFIDSFANSLRGANKKNLIHVIENGQSLIPGNIYLCDGHTYLDAKSELKFVHQKSSANSFNPDINILFDSFIPLCNMGSDILSVILTGIGSDGVDACKNLSDNGSTCITENEQSAIVDGMPNRARESVANIKAYNINEIVKLISEFCD